jgi:hypothetical protein
MICIVKGDNNLQHAFLRRGVKPEVPCKILRHVKTTCKCERNAYKIKFSLFVHSSYLLPDDSAGGLPESLVDESGVFLCRYHQHHHHHHLIIVLQCSYIILGMNNRPVYGRSSEILPSAWTRSVGQSFSQSINQYNS